MEVKSQWSRRYSSWYSYHTFFTTFQTNTISRLCGGPGLRYVDIGSPLPETAFRSKGFNISLVAVLEKPEDAPVYADHPAHVA